MNQIQKVDDCNMNVTNRQDVGLERDFISEVGRVFEYFDKHPAVGFFAGCALTASGIGGCVYYGRKMF